MPKQTPPQNPFPNPIRTLFSHRISVVPCLVIPPVFVKEFIAMTEETTIQERDALTEALNDLFTNVSAMIKGDLQGTNNVLKLLENMNLKVAEEYKGFGDVASGLRVFVERLKAKSENFDEYVQQIDAIEQQVSDLEVVISMLDKYVSLLESKVQSVYHVPTSSA